MGIDLLDVTFRLEKQLDRKLPTTLLWPLCIENVSTNPSQTVLDIRVSRLHERLCEIMNVTPSPIQALEPTRERVMKSIQECLGCDSQAIQLESRLNDIIPIRDREKYWFLISQSLGYYCVPWLTRSWAYEIVCIVLFFGSITGVGLTYISLKQPMRSGAFISLTVSLTALCVIGFWFFRRWPKLTRFPPNLTTVDDLARMIAFGQLEEPLSLKNPPESSETPSESVEWTEERLWTVLVGVLVDSLGVDEEEVVPDATLIKDLGCT